jgi:lipopolysaccharide transport system ATP-binding protein
MKYITIQVEKLSKQYHIGKKQQRYPTLRSTLVDTLAAPIRRAGKLLRGQATGAAELDETIWALKDVSFEVERGEVVGIIGRNGAGKSTLLKVLSRITEPTNGFARIRGRVSSLLEVGTGFHQELTGRENVYLNGAILGMQRTEMNRKFDEIVAFSEVEKFIDTPVKHYSSGMQLRLAFAVAAHLEPEILIIDEVLAVGDARFQRKCINKMQDVGQQGRTVLFVSHNMPAITRLCGRAILLDNGQILEDGPSPQVVSAYLNSGLGTTAAREWPELAKSPGDDVVRLRAVRVKTEDGQIAEAVDIRRPVGLEMEYEMLQPGYVPMLYFRILNQEGILAFMSIDTDPTWRQRPRPVGRYVSTAWIPGNFLAEGTLFVGAAIRTVDPMVRRFHIRDAVAFQVIDSMDGDSARAGHGGSMGGVVRPLLEWNTKFIPNGHQAEER